MELIWQPHEPWWQIALAGWLVLAAALWLAWLRRRPVLGVEPGLRGVMIVSWLAMGGCFVLATLGPEFAVRRPARPGDHLTVVLDVSRSVLRGVKKTSDLTGSVADRLQAALDQMPASVRGRMTGQLVLVGASARTEGEVGSAERLISRIRQLREDQFPPGGATDLAEGLDLARRAMAGRSGNVLLISDGHATTGHAPAAAARLAAQGGVVHTWPLDGAAEALRVRSAYLPAESIEGVPVTLRALFETESDVPLKVTIRVVVHGRGRDGAPPSERTHVVEVTAKQPASVREPVVFTADGLQAVDLVISAEGRQIVRRFFTHVRRPPRVLAVGGDFGWMAAVRTAEMEIITAQAADVGRRTDLDIRRFDAVVVSGVPADAWDRAALEKLAEAVRGQATGLLLINGSHAGRRPEDLSVIGTYAGTALDPVLPVTAEPRAFEVPPPSRQMVLMMDTSGSMLAPVDGRSRMVIAQEIARAIVARLRPEDELQIVGFTTNPQMILPPRWMDDAGRQAALQSIDRLTVGGGTDPGPALALIKDRKLRNGGLIFISDGDFAPTHLRHPDLTTIVFGVGQSAGSMASLRQLADHPVEVGAGFDATRVRIPYFEPQKRTRFFEPGSFVPDPSYRGLSAPEQWPVPQLPVEGTAATVAKAWASSIAWRPRPKERLLALGEAGLGRSAVFTSQIPPGWMASESGRAAVAEWIRRLLPQNERNRHRLRVRDRGDLLELTVALTAPADRPLPDVLGLGAELLNGGGPVAAAQLRPAEAAPAEFGGTLSPVRGATAQDLLLALRETGGADALAARQMIRLTIPPAARLSDTPASEDWSDGRDVAALRLIATRGGGAYDTDEVWPVTPVPPATPNHALWTWLVIAGLGCQLLVAAIRQLAK